MSYEDIKVSVYTQAFNSSQYIPQCIESVLNQTHRNFEYVIVDNGSTDNSRQILLEYKKRDPRIHLICYDENKRSRIREVAKEFFNGEYVTILDSDDWVEPNYLETLIRFAQENNLDIACAQTYSFYEETGESSPLFVNTSPSIVIDHKNFGNDIRRLQNYFSVSWNKIIKKNILDDAYLSADIPRYAGPMDVVLGLRLIRYSRRIGINSLVLHHYRRRRKSANYCFDETYFDAILYLHKELYAFFETTGEVGTVGKQLINELFAYPVQTLFNILKNCSISNEKKICEYHRMFLHPLTREVLCEDQGINSAFMNDGTVADILWTVFNTIEKSTFTKQEKAKKCSDFLQYPMFKCFLFELRNKPESAPQKDDSLRMVLQIGQALVKNNSSDEMLRLVLSYFLPHCFMAVTSRNAKLFLMEDAEIREMMNFETEQMLYDNHYRVYRLLFGSEPPPQNDISLFQALLRDDPKTLLYALKFLARRRRIAKRYGLKEAIAALCKLQEDTDQ